LTISCLFSFCFSEYFFTFDVGSIITDAIMKKSIIISVALLLMTAFSSSEAKDFKDVKQVGEGEGHCSIVEGSLAVLAENATAKLVLDFANTSFAEYDRKNRQFLNPRPLSEYLVTKSEDTPEDWALLVKTLNEFSAEKISKEKTYKLQISDNNPKYEMRLVVDRINFGSTGQTISGRAFGLGGASFSGNLVITEIATGKVALNLRQDYAYAYSSMGYHFTANKRIQCTIGDFFFGRYVPTVYKKNK